MSRTRCSVWLGLLLLVAARPAAADNLCKPAAPLPQSKCVKDAQCCAGLVCQGKRCQPCCRIGGTFHPAGALNPDSDCQSCQPAVSTTAWTNRASGTTCTTRDDGNADTGVDTCEGGTCGACIPADDCSTTNTMACAFNEDCPSGETCVFGTPPSPRFVDNSDGTVTDRKTCLVWEKKTGTPGRVGTFVFCFNPTTCPDPHDVNNVYQWSSSGTAMDGGAFTDFLVKLNSGTGFAGHTDWRLPRSAGFRTVPTGEPAELESIWDGREGCSDACIAPIFGPTRPSGYWSSSTFTGFPNFAWGFNFFVGIVGDGDKRLPLFVRAVRGGA